MGHRRRWPWITLALAVVLVVVGGGVWLGLRVLTVKSELEAAQASVAAVQGGADTTRAIHSMDTSRLLGDDHEPAHPAPMQSFFVVFRGRVASSKAFGDFWRDMTPVSDRRQVIQSYEVGLSQRLVQAGFTMGSYFAESPSDCRLARARVVWWVLHRPAGRAGGISPTLGRIGEVWNSMYALADTVLHDDRLPLVKLDVLRFDPYGLGATRLLRKCERVHPAAFDGVAALLGRTAPQYPMRSGEKLRATPKPLRPLRWLVGYR